MLRKKRSNTARCLHVLKSSWGFEKEKNLNFYLKGTKGSIKKKSLNFYYRLACQAIFGHHWRNCISTMGKRRHDPTPHPESCWLWNNMYLRRVFGKFSKLPAGKDSCFTNFVLLIKDVWVYNAKSSSCQRSEPDNFMIIHL